MRSANLIKTTAFAAAAVAATMFFPGPIGSAKAYADGPFCAENNSRAGYGKQCRFYTYEQCTAFTSGIGGTCSANPWYRYDSAPRRSRERRYWQG